MSTSKKTSSSGAAEKTEQQVIDVAMIAKEVASNAQYSHLLKYLKGRERSRAYTTVERLWRDSDGPSESTVHSFFGMLHRAGAGIFREDGSNWKHSTFFWHARLQETAGAILAALKAGSKASIKVSDLPGAVRKAPRMAPAFTEVSNEGPVAPLARLTAPTPPAASIETSELLGDPLESLEKIHALMKKGILSQTEFNQTKARLLKKML